jgi:hypothetical protein
MGLICSSFSEMARITEPHIKREDDSKYRCKACSKLFKAADFLRKHVPSKHPELVDEELEEVCLFLPFLVSILLELFADSLFFLFSSSAHLLQQLRSGSSSHRSPSRHTRLR